MMAWRVRKRRGYRRTEVEHMIFGVVVGFVVGLALCWLAAG